MVTKEAINTTLAEIVTHVCSIISNIQRGLFSQPESSFQGDRCLWACCSLDLIITGFGTGGGHSSVQTAVSSYYIVPGIFYIAYSTVNRGPVHRRLLVSSFFFSGFPGATWCKHTDVRQQSVRQKPVSLLRCIPSTLRFFITWEEVKEWTDDQVESSNEIKRHF